MGIDESEWLKSREQEQRSGIFAGTTPCLFELLTLD